MRVSTGAEKFTKKSFREGEERQRNTAVQWLYRGGGAEGSGTIFSLQRCSIDFLELDFIAENF